ncbi:hypothetical protein J4Q44_G00051320, partial [Coregonus suidteri]
LPISSPVEPIVVERPISPVVAESLQRFEKNKQLKGLKQQHKKRQKDMETSVQFSSHSQTSLTDVCAGR